LVRLGRHSVSAGSFARRCIRTMTPERRSPPENALWTRLIRTLAESQDREAFATLFEFFAPRIKTFLMRSGTSEAQAEELAQEAMLLVWRKAHLFDPESTGASTWIFTIARNLRIDAYRREKRGAMVEGGQVELEFLVDEAPNPGDRLAMAQSMERIRSAISKLSPDQLRVVELSFFDEKAHAEIAKNLGIPLGTVKSRLRLALGRLRSLMSDFA